MKYVIEVTDNWNLCQIFSNTPEKWEQASEQGNTVAVSIGELTERQFEEIMLWKDYLINQGWSPDHLFITFKKHKIICNLSINKGPFKGSNMALELYKPK